MKKYTYKLFPFLICVVFLFPIVKENIATLSIILLALNLILYKVSSRDFKFIERKQLFLIIPFLIISVFSVFSTNAKISLVHINHSLLFLIVPVIFSLIPKEMFSLEKLHLYFNTLKNLCLLIAFIYIISFFLNNPF